jgi:hypothetical protein
VSTIERASFPAATQSPSRPAHVVLVEVDEEPRSGLVCRPTMLIRALDAGSS